jgi:hypothetical protein
MKPGNCTMHETCDSYAALCKPDAGYCDVSDAGGRRCLPLKATGEACQRYNSCLPNHFCLGSKCVKRIALPGEACGVTSGYPFCTDEYFCRQDTTTSMPPPGTCEARGRLGAVCLGNDSCIPSLRCASSFTTSTCVPRAAEGERCSDYGDCQQTLFCSPRTSRCEKLPGDGGDCTRFGSSYTCASTHYCDYYSPGDQYTCQPRRQQGESCIYDDCLTGVCEYGPLSDGGYARTCVPTCAQAADGGF